MTLTEFISSFEGILRIKTNKLPPLIVTTIYSKGRKMFLSMLSREIPSRSYVPPEDESKILWGIKFNSCIFNAAGMFKHGEGYYTMAAQGAGAYLAGTSTGTYRRGNEMKGVLHPFISYPYSGAASNWMGLPNEGHEELARKIARIEKIEGCPIGVSLSPSPETSDMKSLEEIVNGLNLFKSAGVDFIELNESCPNVPHEQSKGQNVNGLDTNLVDRLEYISTKFIKKLNKKTPLIVKLSNDTDINLLPALLDVLVSLGYGGLNLGNTSTEYEQYKNSINPKDLPLFEYFTRTFGGGLSGRILKEKSFELTSTAAEYIRPKQLSEEFHIIRTGGIENLKDINQSESAGISLNQWFTGYFENFARNGHALYKKLWERHE
jgi:dihydroorotate dehydrogenase